MFYGKSSDQGGGRGGAGGSRSERFDQMMKQQQLIEQKKKEIQARMEVERHQRLLGELGVAPSETSSSSAAGASAAASTPSCQRAKQEEDDSGDDEEGKPGFSLPFSNDGSFLEQFKRMQEEAARKKKEEEEKSSVSKIKEEPIEYDEYGTPINKNKQAIKILHPEDFVRGGPSKGFDRSSNNSNNYYEVPPPPPPPPVRQNLNVGGHLTNETKPKFSNPMGYQSVPPPPPPPPGPAPQSQMQQQQQGSPPKMFGFPSPRVKALATVVAEQGDRTEDELRMKHQGDPLMWFLYKPESTEYRTFRALVQEKRSDFMTHMYQAAPPPPPPPPVIVKQEPSVPIKIEPVPPPAIIKQEPFSSVKIEPVPPPAPVNSYGNFVKSEVVQEGSLGLPESGEMSVASSTALKREAHSPDSEESELQRKKRRSRWGPQSTEVPPVGIAAPPVVGQAALALLPGPSSGINLMNMPLMAVGSAPTGGPSSLISKVTRTNPQLVAYARQAYGRIDLDEDEWKQCEEAYKMNMMFQDIARKRVQDEKLAQAGKVKYEYDSDEETDGGTWEHKRRMQEMEKTKEWATELTHKAKGKHHIGDFLPPEELSKFMEKYKAVKEGKQLDESDYQEFKLQQDNIGFKMLQKMGWSAGEGLGAEKQGVTAPIDKGMVPIDKQGLGAEKPGDLNEEDDEYAAYRKRMMLAYRFRPNPLNNPRRAYY